MALSRRGDPIGRRDRVLVAGEVAMACSHLDYVAVEARRAVARSRMAMPRNRTAAPRASPAKSRTTPGRSFAPAAGRMSSYPFDVQSTFAAALNSRRRRKPPTFDQCQPAHRIELPSTGDGSVDKATRGHPWATPRPCGVHARPPRPTRHSHTPPRPAAPCACPRCPGDTSRPCRPRPSSSCRLASARGARPHAAAMRRSRHVAIRIRSQPAKASTFELRAVPRVSRDVQGRSPGRRAVRVPARRAPTCRMCGAAGSSGEWSPTSLRSCRPCRSPTRRGAA